MGVVVVGGAVMRYLILLVFLIHAFLMSHLVKTKRDIVPTVVDSRTCTYTRIPRNEISIPDEYIFPAGKTYADVVSVGICVIEGGK